MQKKNIAVFFGGKSAEHDVSIITAHVPIIDALLATNEYNVYPVYITRNGVWHSLPAMLKLDFFQKSGWEENLGKSLNFSIENGLHIIWPGFFSKKVKIDIAFPSMHGTYGEDGSLMGLLRMAGVPFVGCDLSSSVVAMDKVLTKQIVSLGGMKVVPYVWFTRFDWNENRENIKKDILNLKFPLFVKPVHLGSSIGISKVKTKEDLDSAIEVALHYDDKVLVEEGVENLIEVTLPIIGNQVLELALVEQPLNKSEFFDFQDKYLGDGGKNTGGVNNQYSELPAKLDPSMYKEVEDLGRKVYKTVGLSGIARIDFLIDASSKNVYVNEINTLPGSLYIHNWKKAGLSGVVLIKKLIAFAEERFASQEATVFNFKSDVLSKAGGAKNSN